MIELLIIFLHIVAAIYVFTENWQRSGYKDGFMAMSVLALVFIIGWSLASTLAGVIYPATWTFAFFNKDTFSLCLLLVPEVFFFYFYFIKAGVSNKQENSNK